MTAEPWRFALASVIGGLHVDSGMPCQDRSACRLVPAVDGPWLTAIVSDGAGSALHADTAAELSVTHLMALIEAEAARGTRLAQLVRETAIAWVGDVARVLDERSEADGVPLYHYSCTLLAAIVGPDEAVFLQIGDGAIVVSPGGGEGWTPMFWPQHGPYSNTTNFVISPAMPEQLAFASGPRAVADLAVFSDGIEALVLDPETRSAHQPFFSHMIRPVWESAAEGEDPALSEALAQVLTSPEIRRQTGDDTTLILASRGPRVAPLTPSPA